MRGLIMKEKTETRLKADELGITYHHNANDATIQKMIDAHAVEEFDPNKKPDNIMSLEECAPMDPEEFERRYNNLGDKRKECNRLIRCRIQCMDPQKREWPGEIISVGSAKLGTFKKYIPFNSAEPYHIPKIIYDVLVEKKCTIFYTDTDERGNKVRVGHLKNAYAIEVLDPLTPDELSHLGRTQALKAGQQ
jgi:hypothetical protein